MPNRPVVILSECDADGAGQGRDIDEMRGAQSASRTTSASPRMSRPSASVLMTSTVLPDALFSTSPGLMARPPGMFSAIGMTPMTRIGAFSSREGAHGTGDGGTAGHVVLHPIHVCRGLDRDAARVERDPLADQPQHRTTPPRRRARTVSTTSRGGSALPRPTPSSMPMPSRSSSSCIEHAHRQSLPRARFRTSRSAKTEGRQRVAGLVVELPRDIAVLGR